MPTKPVHTEVSHTAEYITLKDYIDSRIDSIDKSIDAARETMEIRLTGMNEFRDALRDQSKTFVTKSEYCTAHDRIIEDIRSLREFRAALEGKASQSSVNIAMLISILGVIMGIIGLVLAFIGN